MPPQLVAADPLSVFKMDFQFTLHFGRVMAKCSMEHEAVAYWLNSEIATNPDLVHSTLHRIQQLNAQQHCQILGKEYSLEINCNEVIVRANHLALESEVIWEEGLHYYDSESIACCGIEDFVHFLQSYLDFVQSQGLIK